MSISGRLEINKTEGSSLTKPSNMFVETLDGVLSADEVNTAGILSIADRGADGYSPIIETEDIENSEGVKGQRITITTILGTESFEIWDGNGISRIWSDFNSDNSLTIYFELQDGTLHEITTGSLEGPQGPKGDTGNGIDSIEHYYTVTTTQDEPISSEVEWSLTIPKMSNEDKYLWQKEIINFTESESQVIITLLTIYGDKGDTGQTGPQGPKGNTGGYFVPQVIETSAGKFITWEWVPESSELIPPAIINYDELTGNGIANVEYYYAVTDNTEVPSPETVISTSIPELTDINKYLWQKQVITYTDNTSIINVWLIGEKGDKGDRGRGILNIIRYYARNNSAVSAPPRNPGVYDTNPLIPTKDYRYVWSYDRYTYTDGSTPTETSSSLIGMYGEKGDTGNGVDSIVEYYAVNNSTTAPPLSEFTTTIVNVTPENKYLWNYYVINYTENPPETSDCRILAVYGDKGEIGLTGGYYVPKVVETSESKFIEWRWVSPEESSESSEVPDIIDFEELRGPKGDKGDTGPIGTTFTKIEPYAEASDGEWFQPWGINSGSSEEIPIGPPFEFSLGTIIWDCGTSTEVMPPEWPEGEV